MVLAPLKIFFCENELCIIQNKDKCVMSHDFVFLKVHILKVHNLCYICIDGIFLTNFSIMNCLLSFIWKLIDHKFLGNIFVL